MKPNFQTYGNYNSGNYGVHSLVFSDHHGNDFYFSYKTLVAFSKRGYKIVVSKNYWSRTTGKHLNWINSDKESRVDHDTFEKLYFEYFGKKLDV